MESWQCWLQKSRFYLTGSGREHRKVICGLHKNFVHSHSRLAKLNPLTTPASVYDKYEGTHFVLMVRVVRAFYL
jgi:hypothetical protein